MPNLDHRGYTTTSPIYEMGGKLRETIGIGNSTLNLSQTAAVKDFNDNKAQLAAFADIYCSSNRPTCRLRSTC